MNKVILLLAFFLGGFLSTADAQKGKKNNPSDKIADKKAKDILAGVSKKYKSYNVIKAEFTFTLENTAEKTTDSYTGILFVKPSGNKYKIDLNKQEIISDGKSTWTYLKDAKEVQVNVVETGDDAINPAQIFTIYEKGYSYIFVEEKNIKGKMCQVIELTPTNKTKNIFKARLIIDKTLKQLVEIKLFEKNGNRYNYSVKNMTANPKVDDQFFTFDKKKYPGVDVIDLR